MFAAISANAQTVAITKREHRRRLSNGGSEVIANSAVNKLLRTPNHYETGSQIMLNTVHDLLGSGNAYWVGHRGANNQFESVHLVRASYAQPYVDGKTGAVFYGLGREELRGLDDDDYQYLVPARDVMHMRLHTPDHSLVGVSPIRYTAMSIDANNAIMGNQSAFFSNMRRPSGIITTDEKFNATQMRELRQAWDEQSKNLNAGGVPILSSGLKWQGMSITSQDAQLVEGYDMTVADIARAFRIPLPLIGDLRNSTFNNAETLLQFWLATGLGFLLEHLERSFESFFALPANEFIEFDTAALLRSDFSGRIDALTKGITGGLYSPNEARRREGLPEVEFGDEPRLQAQVVPLSQVDQITTAPTVPTAPAANESDDNAAPTESAASLPPAAVQALFEKAMNHE